jgi:hypothetical protein
MLEKMDRPSLEPEGLAAFAILSTAVLWLRFDVRSGGGAYFPTIWCSTGQ